MDVTPDGKYLVVAGKLDPHVTIYGFDKIQTGHRQRELDPDVYGIPMLNFDDVMVAQLEVGLGPLHTQFDDKGNAYTSLFLDSMVAKWKLGGDDPAAYTVLNKVPVQYNIGHLVAAEGDTVSARRQVSDRAQQVGGGPLHAGRPAAAAERAADRHQRRRDAGDLRHGHGHRRAALRPDDQGRQDQRHQRLS